MVNYSGIFITLALGVYLSEQEFDNWLVRIWFSIVQSSVAVAVFSEMEKNKCLASYSKHFVFFITNERAQ